MFEHLRERQQQGQGHVTQTCFIWTRVEGLDLPEGFCTAVLKSSMTTSAMLFASLSLGKCDLPLRTMKGRPKSNLFSASASVAGLRIRMSLFCESVLRLDHFTPFQLYIVTIVTYTYITVCFFEVTCANSGKTKTKKENKLCIVKFTSPSSLKFRMIG